MMGSSSKALIRILAVRSGCFLDPGVAVKELQISYHGRDMYQRRELRNYGYVIEVTRTRIHTKYWGSLSMASLYLLLGSNPASRAPALLLKLERPGHLWGA